MDIVCRTFDLLKKYYGWTLNLYRYFIVYINSPAHQLSCSIILHEIDIMNYGKSSSYSELNYEMLSWYKHQHFMCIDLYRTEAKA